MKLPLRRAAQACLISVLVAAGHSAAAGTLSFVAEQGVYSAAPSTAVTVNVYLRETIQSGGVFILASEGGIFGYDVRVGRTSGAAVIVAMDANLSQFSMPLGVTKFPDPIPAGGVAVGEFSVSALDDPGAMGVLSGNTRTIFLGAFSIQTAANIGDASTFVVSDSQALSSNTVTNAPPGTVLDSLIAPGTFEVRTIPVPEPESALAMLAGMGLAALVFCRSARHAPG